MILRSIFSRTFFVVLAVLVFEAYPAYGIIVDRIAAIVNGDVITLSELEGLAQPLIQKYINEEMSKEEMETTRQEILSQVLPELINERLAQEEIKKLDIKVGEQEIEKALDQICEDNRITREQLSEKLAYEGHTLEEYKKELKQQIERAELINAQVRAKIVITDEQVNEYLKEHPLNNSSNAPLYIMQHICAKFKEDDPESRKDARRRIEEAHNILKEGKVFEEVARHYSDFPSGQDGGYLGAFTLKDMALFVKQAVVNLQPGDFSDIVDTRVGWQIFRLKEIVQSGQTDLGSAQIKEVRKKLYQKQTNARFEEWLKELRSKSIIQTLL
ncbi:MAG: peptidylprolyl isomerase [Deltaproteobacteria bacterium]|nr:peptidylprolyl isomerase [Deltaproteobacteria bacterium]MBW1937246.1 peptidylprolyl isomerase [Deltaproteobacteria bacterium]